VVRQGLVMVMVIGKAAAMLMLLQCTNECLKKLD
jgi:hypothetical protein